MTIGLGVLSRGSLVLLCPPGRDLCWHLDALAPDVPFIHVIADPSEARVSAYADSPDWYWAVDRQCWQLKPSCDAEVAQEYSDLKEDIILEALSRPDMADHDTTLDEQKKVVLPFMQRAQEVEKADLKVAYYCRMYAIEQAVAIPKRAKEINALISAAISKLEKDKASLSLDKNQDKVHCEAFALRVFANADKVDRMGKADLGTSKGFYAASCFIDILNQFSPLDADMQSKQKYALWRAAEIRKALREGRPPVPPPAGEETPITESQSQLVSGGASFSMAGVRTLDESAPGSITSTTQPSFSAPNSSYSAPSPPSWSAPAPPSYPAPAQPGSPPSYPTPAQPALQHQPSFSQGSGLVLPGQRYKPGSPVLFCESAGVGSNSHEEKGTVGHVSLDADGLFKYKVALRDRLVQANDMQVAPCPMEGAPVAFIPRPGAPPSLAHVVLVNDGMGWPPTYLVSLPDGSEVSAQSHQLSLILPEELPPAAPPAPAPPSWGGDSQRLVSHASASSTHSNGPPGTGYDTPPAAQPPGATLWSAHPQPPMPPPAHASSMQRPAAPPQAPSYPPQGGWQAPAAAPAYSAAPPPAAAGWITLPALAPGHKPSVVAISEAQKAARTAVSSLNFEDAASAIKYLSHAIALLTTPPGAKLPHL